MVLSYRIKSTTEQHRIVTDSTGILGRCVTELMWCVRQQDIECSRVYSHSELSPDELSRRGKVSDCDIKKVVSECCLVSSVI